MSITLNTIETNDNLFSLEGSKDKSSELGVIDLIGQKISTGGSYLSRNRYNVITSGITLLSFVRTVQGFLGKNKCPAQIFRHLVYIHLFISLMKWNYQMKGVFNGSLDTGEKELVTIIYPHAETDTTGSFNIFSLFNYLTQIRPLLKKYDIRAERLVTQKSFCDFFSKIGQTKQRKPSKIILHCHGHKKKWRLSKNVVIRENDLRKMISLKYLPKDTHFILNSCSGLNFGKVIKQIAPQLIVSGAPTEIYGPIPLSIDKTGNVTPVFLETALDYLLHLLFNYSNKNIGSTI